MHVGVFLIQSVFFIHLVCRCASLTTTFALSQSMTCMFCSTAWSVMDVSYTALPCPGGSGMCTSCERVHFFISLFDPQNKLPACLLSV